MATNRDVAKAAGVSISTVSHTLNDTRPVSPEKRAAVLAAAAALGYRPNAIARSLTTKVTKTVGVIVADIMNPFFAALVRGVEDGLGDLRYDLLVRNTDERAEREESALRMLVARRADGIVIAPTGADHAGGADLKRLGIPTLSIDRRSPSLSGPLVAIDNDRVSERATRHLLELGHRRLVFVARGDVVSTVAGRVAGFWQALHGVDRAVGEVCTTEASSAAAFAVTRGLLARGPDRPTAILAGNHAIALGVIRALQEAGLSCPGDVSIVGFDDHPWASLLSPPLTVVRIPVEEMCRAACDLLRTMMLGEPAAAARVAAKDVVLAAELVVRGSTGPPARVH
ncbi:LacI family DNA-binding transcriptional regulator [soil metagenome]